MSVIVSSTLDTWERHVNRRLASGLVTFARRTGGTQWSGWRSADLGSNRSVVLLLHGTGGARHSWAPVLEHLDPSIGVLAPDLPGHGLSACDAHARHGLRDMAADLIALIEAEGLSRIDVVVGHSAGAAVALELVVEAPVTIEVDAVLGIAPSLVPPPSLYSLLLGPLLAPLVGSEPSVQLAALLARSTGMTDRLLASTGSRIDERQRDAYRLLLGDAAQMRGAINFMAATDLPALLERLREVRVPCEFIVAEDDPWIPVVPLTAIIAKHLPRARVELWRGGHMLPEADPQRVAEAIALRISRARANGMGR